MKRLNACVKKRVKVSKINSYISVQSESHYLHAVWLNCTDMNSESPTCNKN